MCTSVFCFIVLHYQGYDDTVACVNAIKKLYLYNESKIVIIDNASPNKSGGAIYRRYQDDNNIDVLLNGSNIGFSKANNVACAYASRKYNPNFYIVMNNDVIIEDLFFLDKIKKEYKQSEFCVLGPDIYNPQCKVHQSPIAGSVPSNISLTKTIIGNKMLIKFLPLSKKLIVDYFNRLYEKTKNAQRYNERQLNVCLMGACLIFSRAFYEERKVLFYPETEFYYEEYILHLHCMNTSKKIVYNPQLKVIHNSGASTKKTYSDELERDVFIIENTIKAAEICKKYRKQIKRGDKTNGEKGFHNYTDI